MKGSLWCALALVALVVGCQKKQPQKERTEPWLASARPSASASALPRRVPYRLAASRVDFELPTKRGTPKGKVGSGTGELDVDLDDLSHTTGKVGFDLSTLELTGTDGSSDAPNTARALDWLELGAGIAADRRDTLRQVSFELGSLDAGHVVSAPSEERPSRRRELASQWQVRGELSLHGVRAPGSADVTLTLVPGPDPAGPPAELLIRSRQPFVIVLGTHDIRPREQRGLSIAKDQGVLGDGVGREARVSFELTFTPRP